uniref:Uncharacterized protein n=1 Tax=Rhizophagus irregularis (strain DAOM 181602 / DAOM 197198 / MUCL 43194) TaxID=747089 RepID=U9UDZ6_RHIID
MCDISKNISFIVTSLSSSRALICKSASLFNLTINKTWKDHQSTFYFTDCTYFLATFCLVSRT